MPGGGANKSAGGLSNTFALGVGCECDFKLGFSFEGVNWFFSFFCDLVLLWKIISPFKPPFCLEDDVGAVFLLKRLSIVICPFLEGEVTFLEGAELKVPVSSLMVCSGSTWCTVFGADFNRPGLFNPESELVELEVDPTCCRLCREGSLFFPGRLARFCTRDKVKNVNGGRCAIIRETCKQACTVILNSLCLQCVHKDLS